MNNQIQQKRGGEAEKYRAEVRKKINQWNQHHLGSRNHHFSGLKESAIQCSESYQSKDGIKQSKVSKLHLNSYKNCVHGLYKGNHTNITCQIKSY